MIPHTPPPTNGGLTRLLPHHLADLRRSGLSDAVIIECGFYSETDPAAVAKLLYRPGPANALVPCLVFPFVAADGSDAGYAQVKPDTPYARTPGKKPAKYLSPSLLGFRAYFPPGTRQKVSDPTVPLILTEGAKKAAAADQHGFACVALAGVEAWSLKRPKGEGGKPLGERALIPDLAAIPWQDRLVYVTYDSDAATKPNVGRAEKALARALRVRGARVRVIRLPAGPDGAKVGLDDFLLARGPDALLALLAGPLKDCTPVATPAAEAEAGPYLISGGVICRRRFTRDGEVTEPLCNFTCRITAQVARDDGAEVTRTLTLEGRHQSGRPLPPVQIPADQFAGMSWVLTTWGNRAAVYAGFGTKDHLRAAVQLLSGEAPERTVYTHTGWRQVGTNWVYLHGGGGVGADGPVAGVAVDLCGPLAGFRLPDPPVGDKLRAAVRASLGIADGRLAPDRVTVPLLAAVYRAALGPADFAVHLYGPTGSFKSELAALAQQHFGAGLDARHLPANWLSTANALEGTLFAAKDGLVVVDDFNPTGAVDPAKLHAAADRVFRGLGNGAGRERMNARLEVRPPRPPRGLVLSTGEDVPRGHSCLARLLVTEVRPGDVAVARLSGCQREAADGVYAAALSGFTRWLAGRYEGVRPGLKAERDRLREGLARGAAHARTATAVADLLLGWQYLLDFALAAGAVTPAEAASLLTRGRETLLELGGGQAEHLQAADPVD